ncbi:hypothetical protein BGX28_009257, partial [Mortierella sp. GBA30]
MAPEHQLRDHKQPFNAWPVGIEPRFPETTVADWDDVSAKMAGNVADRVISNEFDGDIVNEPDGDNVSEPDEDNVNEPDGDNVNEPDGDNVNEPDGNVGFADVAMRQAMPSAWRR